jgi:hypothetical protein
LPSEQRKFVAHPFWVMTQTSGPHAPLVDHVPAMLSHAPAGAALGVAVGAATGAVAGGGAPFLVALKVQGPAPAWHVPESVVPSKVPVHDPGFPFAAVPA